MSTTDPAARSHLPPITPPSSSPLLKPSDSPLTAARRRESFERKEVDQMVTHNTLHCNKLFKTLLTLLTETACLFVNVQINRIVEQAVKDKAPPVFRGKTSEQ